jgi:hypothetical protein
MGVLAICKSSYMRRCCGFVKQMLEKPELKDESELEIFEKCPERKKIAAHPQK